MQLLLIDIDRAAARQLAVALLWLCAVAGCGSSGVTAPTDRRDGSVTRDAALESSGSTGDTGSREAQGDAMERTDVVAEGAPGNDAGLLPTDATAEGDSAGETGDTDSTGQDADASSGIDGGPPTTGSILDAQSEDCLSCAARSGCLDPALQGGTCESTSGVAPAACGPLLGSTGAVSETEVCLSALNTLFTSGCAATAQGETPCLCGTTDSAMCLAGTAAPTGPLVALYDCDLRPADIDALVFRFTDQASGAGQANALVQCLAAFSCDCFGM